MVNVAGGSLKKKKKKIYCLRFISFDFFETLWPLKCRVMAVFRT